MHDRFRVHNVLVTSGISTRGEDNVHMTGHCSQVGNIVAPITTHAAYELWIVGASLLRCRVEKTALAASLNRDFSRKEKL
jgi:hypothetical protein